uniref:Integrase n=1 Tax=Beta vulgaris TaxID=161934 RepID=A2I5F2_BETVU|nr:integrase [Beta vulgaris]
MAIDDEFNALIKNKTWELVPRPTNANIIRSMWIFAHKEKSIGSFERYKARLVGDGKTQQVGIDCGETFSPVVKPAIIRLVLSIALSKSWLLHQVDVKNAFLHGELNETVYMHQPSGYKDFTYPNHVVYFYLSGKYAEEIIERAGMSACKPSSTRVDTRPKLSAHSTTPCSDHHLYTSLVGALQYLIFTRPDISYVVQQIYLFMHKPMEEHMNAPKRIVRYVKVLSHMAYTYIRPPSPLSYLILMQIGVDVLILGSLRPGNPVQHQRTKHIEMDIHFVREKVAHGEVRDLHFLSSSDR